MLAILMVKKYKDDHLNYVPKIANTANFWREGNSLSQIWRQWLKFFPRVLVFPLSFSIKMGSKLSLIGDRGSSVIGCLWTWHGGWLSTELSFSLISREMEQKQAIWNKNRPLFLGTYTAARGGFFNIFLVNMKIWTIFFGLIQFV